MDGAGARPSRSEGVGLIAVLPCGREAVGFRAEVVLRAAEVGEEVCHSLDVQRLMEPLGH